MPKSFADISSDKPAFYSVAGKLSIGIIWGGIAGALIGAGISMTIGLFYSSATTLIFSVILGSSILGAIFGQITAGLLADDIVIKGYAHTTSHGLLGVNSDDKPLVDLCEHKTLKQDKKDNILSNQDVMKKINAMRNREATLPRHADTQVFELVVSQAHKTRVSLGQPVMAMKSLS